MTTASTPQDETVTKGQFAALINVSAGRVSQLIAEQKISGAALVGEGRNARINVRIAKAQLRQRLDIGQRLGNGLDTRLADAPPAPAVQLEMEPQPHGGSLQRLRATETASDQVEERIKLARLAEYEARNRKTAEEEQARRGAYTRTADVRAAMGKLAATLIGVFEGGLPDLATALAEAHQIPHRDVLHTLREAFRDLRLRAAAEIVKAAQSQPALLQDEVADATDPAAGRA